MRALFVCLVVALAAPATLGASSGTKLFATFKAPGQDPKREESFFELPRQTPTSDGWALAEDLRETDGVAIYCRKNDYRLCVLFDKKGSVAGLQISMAVVDLQMSKFAPAANPSVLKRVLGLDVYATTVYFVEQSVLKAGGRDLDVNTPTAPNGLFFPSKTGQFRRMPLTENEVPSAANFRRQGCIPNMGRHYFNVNKQMKCEDVEPFFGLYNEQTHELVGGGTTLFGKASSAKGTRVWMEAPPPQIIKFISPDSPDCVTKLSMHHGLTSLHFYMNDEPWNIRC